MRIEVKYSVSDYPHPIVISRAEIDQMRQSGQLTATQPTPKGDKTLTITGSRADLSPWPQPS